MMNDSSQRSARITANDRAWFLTHPEAVIRFRPIRAHELESLKMHGIRPPEFRPSWCKSSAALEKVAVIDLIRLLQSNPGNKHPNETLRIRLVTIKARSKQLQASLQKELISAVCKELMCLVIPSIPSDPEQYDRDLKQIVA